MRGILNLLVWPTLAFTAAIVQPRDSPVVEMVLGSGQTIGGNACQIKQFGQVIDIKKTNLTLIFDQYEAFVGPSSPQDSREVFCNYQMTITFPKGCTTATITTHPRGELRLKDQGTAKFSAQYDVSTGNHTANPPEIPLSGSQYVGQGKTFDLANPVDVMQTIRNENERNITFTARTRLFLEAPGITNSDTSDFVVYATDILISNTKSC